MKKELTPNIRMTRELYGEFDDTAWGELFEQAFGKGATKIPPADMGHGDEKDIASAIIQVALAEEGMSEDLRMLLSSLCGALLAPEGSSVKLSVHGTKRGPRRKQSGAQKEELQRMLTYHSMGKWFEERLGKKEAAVAALQEFFKVSRSTVYAELKLAEEVINGLPEPERTGVSKQILEFDWTAFFLQNDQ